MRLMYTFPLFSLLLVAPPLSAQVTPGQWESITTMHKMEMPGMPPEVAAMMQKRGQQTIRSTYCLTPEEARRGPQDMLKQHKSCRFDEYSMKDGKVRARMHCKEEGVQSTMQMEGSYTPTSYVMQMDMTMAGRMAMHTKSTVKGRLVGQCTAKK